MGRVTVLDPVTDDDLGREVTVWALSDRGHRTHGQGGMIIARDWESVTISTKCYGTQRYTLLDHVVDYEQPYELNECMQYAPGLCKGEVRPFSPRGLVVRCVVTFTLMSV